jgi:hypothetical protein
MTTSIPSALYAHPDPLLSRLRLNDSKGNFIDRPAASSSELRDVKVIGLLFGAEVERERGQFSREFYKVDHVSHTGCNLCVWLTLALSYTPANYNILTYLKHCLLSWLAFLSFHSTPQSIAELSRRNPHRFK